MYLIGIAAFCQSVCGNQSEMNGFFSFAFAQEYGFLVAQFCIEEIKTDSEETEKYLSLPRNEEHT